MCYGKQTDLFAQLFFSEVMTGPRTYFLSKYWRIETSYVEMLISMMLKKSEVFELFYIYYGFLKRYLKSTQTVQKQKILYFGI